MTIYPEDYEAVPRTNSEMELAEYIIANLEAHYNLFGAKGMAIAKYESLRMDRTREGKIYKEIFLRALDVATLKNLNTLTVELLRDALARIALPQRRRLARMAYVAPVDWHDSTP